MQARFVSVLCNHPLKSPTETSMLEVGVGRFPGPVASYVGIASSRTEISALGPIC